MLEHSLPLAVSDVVTCKPGRHLTYLPGGSGEFAKEENPLVIRLGLEYSWELP